ncbi:MAG TPA: hypothetical protein VM778_02295 [Gemmatimonadota bacterium]|nr:hypothetical protein [Gemmatimonadota bacterium]
MAKTMALALQDARIDAGLVDYVSARGTSTRLNASVADPLRPFQRIRLWRTQLLPGIRALTKGES